MLYKIWFRNDVDNCDISTMIQCNTVFEALQKAREISKETGWFLKTVDCVHSYSRTFKDNKPYNDRRIKQ